MALTRLNVPGLILYGGSIAPGRFQNRDVTIADVFEAVGAHVAGRLTDSELQEVENRACPGRAPVAVSTPPTPWPPSMEFIGLSPMGTASIPATDLAKTRLAYAAASW